MKKYLLLFLFTTIILSESKAQYHPMLGDTTEWCLAWNVMALRSPEVRLMEYDNFVAKTDTIIDSLSYKKIFTNLIVYYGAMREDTSAQQVYFIISGDSVEHLLYDFTLNTGDPFVVDLQNNMYGNMNDGTYIVDTTYMMNIRGGLRKYIRLHNALNISTGGDSQPLKLEWIESVGDIHNTIYTYAYDNFGYSPLNYCGNYHESAIMKQTFNTSKNYVDICSAMNVGGDIYSDTCQIDYWSGIQEYDKQIQLTVYPNPGNGNLIIVDVVNYSLKNNCSILINDPAGSVIYNKPVLRSGNSIKITDLRIPAGVYFITLIEDNTVFAKTKLIIEN